MLESVDTNVVIRATTTSMTLLVTGVGLIVVPYSAGALSLGNETLQEIIMN